MSAPRGSLAEEQENPGMGEVGKDREETQGEGGFQAPKPWKTISGLSKAVSALTSEFQIYSSLARKKVGFCLVSPRTDCASTIFRYWVGSGAEGGGWHNGK